MKEVIKAMVYHGPGHKKDLQEQERKREMQRCQ